MIAENGEHVYQYYLFTLRDVCAVRDAWRVWTVRYHDYAANYQKCCLSQGVSIVQLPHLYVVT